MRPDQKNARFLEWTNGDWVTLTLRPHVPLHHCSGGPTDEGWHYSETRYELIDGIVQCDRSWSAMDCDGKGSGGASFTCPINRLAAREIDEDHKVLGVPDWEHLDENSWRRDYEAERAGY